MVPGAGVSMSDLSERLARLPPEKLQHLLRELMVHARPHGEPTREAEAEAVAVVGIGCRLPGGIDGPEALWRSLIEGRELVGPLPRDRRELHDVLDRDVAAAKGIYSRHGAFVDGLDRADFRFFGIPPSQARFLDPQHRMLLEVTWEALEHAGYPADRLEGSATGVFLGIASADYQQTVLAGGMHAPFGAELGLGTAASLAAGRLSYHLGLRGPAITVDTACSSSLVAVHLSRRSLLARECDVAIAAGVQVILAPQMFLLLCSSGALSPDGRCRSFDAAANGFVRGEGCGVVILRRLSDALKNRDEVIAVIRGSSVNQDGRSNGQRAPSGRAQEDVIRRALAEAQIDPADVSYVEAHGTATPIGDAVEAIALSRALRDQASSPCFIGSIKTNLGHLEAAAGIVGLIKASCMVRERRMVPSLHYKTPNPHIARDAPKIQVSTDVSPWPHENTAIAGVNSFSWSGTNAFVVLEEPSPVAREVHRDLAGPVLMPWSARDPVALRMQAGRWARWIESRPDASMEDIAYTACARRTHLEHRAVAIAHSRDMLVARLHAFAEGDSNWLAVGRRPMRGRPRTAWWFGKDVDIEVQRRRVQFLAQFAATPDVVVGSAAAAAAAGLITWDEARDGAQWQQKASPKVALFDDTHGQWFGGGPSSSSTLDALRDRGVSVVVHSGVSVSVELLGSAVHEGDLHAALAQLFVLGWNLDLAQACSSDARLVRLPTYPWQREKAWWSDEIGSQDDRV